MLAHARTCPHMPAHAYEKVSKNLRKNEKVSNNLRKYKKVFEKVW